MGSISSLILKIKGSVKIREPKIIFHKEDTSVINSDLACQVAIAALFL